MQVYEVFVVTVQLTESDTIRIIQVHLQWYFVIKMFIFKNIHTHTYPQFTVQKQHSKWHRHRMISLAALKWWNSIICIHSTHIFTERLYTFHRKYYNALCKCAIKIVCARVLLWLLKRCSMAISFEFFLSRID